MKFEQETASEDAASTLSMQFAVPPALAVPRRTEIPTCSRNQLPRNIASNLPTVRRESRPGGERSRIDVSCSMTMLLTRKVETPLLPPQCQAWIEQFSTSAIRRRIARVEDFGFAS